MGRIASRKNTSPGFSLPGLDGLREKWRRRFGPDDDVSRPAAEDDKRAPGQIHDEQDRLATASPRDASYALAIGSAADEDEPLPAPIGSAGHHPDYLAEVTPRTVSPPAPPHSGVAQRGKTLLATLWHLPDGFKWMGPAAALASPLAAARCPDGGRSFALALQPAVPSRPDGAQRRDACADNAGRAGGQ